MLNKKAIAQCSIKAEIQRKNEPSATLQILLRISIGLQLVILACYLAYRQWLYMMARIAGI